MNQTVQFSEKMQKLLESLGLKVLDVLLENTRKKTAALLVESANKQKMVFKYCSEEAPTPEKKRFLNEIEFYRQPRTFISTPAPVQTGINYLLLEYVSGTTLRREIVRLLRSNRGPDTTKGFEALMDALLEFLMLSYLKPLEEGTAKTAEKVGGPNALPHEAARELVRIYRNLASSGPHQTTRSGFSKKLSILQARVTRNKVRKKIQELLEQNPSALLTGNVHGDLHADNVLVSKENQLLAIDFAHYAGNGLIIKDLIYLFTTLLVILEGDLHFKKAFIHKAREVLQAKQPSLVYILKIALIMHHIGKTNRRFNSEVSGWKILKSYLVLFPELIREFKSEV